MHSNSLKNCNMKDRTIASISESKTSKVDTEGDAMAREQDQSLQTKKRLINQTSGHNKCLKTSDQGTAGAHTPDGAESYRSPGNLQSNLDDRHNFSRKEISYKYDSNGNLIKTITTDKLVTKKNILKDGVIEETITRKTTTNEIVMKEETTKKTSPRKRPPIDHPGSPITEEMKKFKSSYYQPYKLLGNDQASAAKAKHNFTTLVGFAKYDNFTLVWGNTNRKIDLRQLPTINARLDDYWVGRVATAYDKYELNANWPAEFDTKGMLRSKRAPLGEPCILRVNPGAMDVCGRVSESGGLYFGWYHGLQLMCGDQGLETFCTRPCHQETPCTGIGWRVGYEVPKNCQYDCLVLEAEDVHTNPYM